MLAQELVKVLGRPIDTACTFLENILAVPTKRFGELLGDQVSYWQWCNRLRIIEKAEGKLKAKGISPRQLPLDFAIPFLHDCGDTSDPDLQDWWANLLAGSVEGASAANVAFVKALQSMGPAEVKFLDAMIATDPADNRDARMQAIAASGALSLAQATTAFHNLERLGFFTPTGHRLKGFAFDLLEVCYPHPDRLTAYKERQAKLRRALIWD